MTSFLSFVLVCTVVYTLGYFEVNIWTAAFALVFGGIWALTIFGH